MLVDEVQINQSNHRNQLNAGNLFKISYSLPGCHVMKNLKNRKSCFFIGNFEFRLIGQTFKYTPARFPKTGILRYKGPISTDNQSGRC
jgi:hypothetical protein